MENVTKFDYSRKISKSRNYGNINEAIDLALEAKKKYPEENIFEKFLGDLYFQINNYEAAGNAYINFLLKIDSHVEYRKRIELKNY